MSTPGKRVLGQAAGGGAGVAARRRPAARRRATCPRCWRCAPGSSWLEGRTLHNVVVGGSRDGLVWRANVDADELNGYVEYRQPAGPGGGRLHARLARLSIAASAATEVESLLDEQPDNLPALDIVVDDFELRGKKLGRLEIDAVNRGAGAVAREGGVREWRLNKLNLSMPEAVFSATGNWAGAERAGGARAGAGPGTRRPRAAPHRHELPARHRRLGPAAGALRHEGRGAARQGPHGRPGGLARLAADAGLPVDERQLLRQRRGRPVPQGRPGPGQAAGRAQPAVAAAPAGAGLPRRVQRGLRLRFRARRRHHRAGHRRHQQPADEGRERGGADGRPAPTSRARRRT